MVLCPFHRSHRGIGQSALEIGQGKGGVRGVWGGLVDFWGFFQEGERPRGRPGGCLPRIGESGGGGLDIFFRGRNVHQVAPQVN